MSKELLDHAESVLEDFCDDIADTEVLDVALDPYTTEEKIVMAAEEDQGLDPADISELVQEAMSKLPEFANPEEVDVAFDVLYDLVSEIVNA